VKDHKKSHGHDDETIGDGKDSGKNSKEKDFINQLNNIASGKDSQTIGGGAVNKVTKFKTFNFEKRTHTKYSFPLCHFDGYNLWLLKPTHLNRGRGIHVFRDLETLHKLIKEYC
jgi:hypothetical protein